MMNNFKHIAPSRHLFFILEVKLSIVLSFFFSFNRTVLSLRSGFLFFFFPSVLFFLLSSRLAVDSLHIAFLSSPHPLSCTS